MTTVTIESFGGVPNGSDCTNAFFQAIAALTAAGGGTLILQSGATYSIDYIAWSNAGVVLMIPANTSIVSSGATRAKVQFSSPGTGNTSSVFFARISQSNAALRGLHIDMGGSIGSGIDIRLPANAPADIANILIDDCAIENCASEFGYLTIVNASAARNISNVRIQNEIMIISRQGNVPVSARKNIAATYAGIYIIANSGQNQSNPSSVNDIYIENMCGNFNYIKKGIAAFGNINYMIIENANINNCGHEYIADSQTGDFGYYTIAFYNWADIPNSPPRNIYVNNLNIDGSLDCAIYMASCVNCTISNGYIANQKNIYTANIPKGAISINGSVGVTVESVNFFKNIDDVIIVGPVEDKSAKHLISGCRSDQSTYSIRILGGAGAQPVWRDCQIIDHQCTEAAVGLALQFAGGGGVKNLLVADSRFEARPGSGQAMTLAVLTGPSTPSGNVSFTNCYFAASQGAVVFSNPITGGRLRFDSCTIAASTSAVNFQIASGQSNLRLVNNEFLAADANRVSIPAPGANCFAQGNRFGDDCVAAGSLMTAKPTHVGIAGDFVQKSNPGKAGTSPNEYVVNGWTCLGGTNWVESRTLTGT